MSIAGINAKWGSTVSVYRPTEGADSISWGSAVLSGIKLDLMPVTDEIARKVFGAEVLVETMALTTEDIRKGDGVVVSAGPHNGQRFRVHKALTFHQFTQLGLVGTTEAIP